MTSSLILYVCAVAVVAGGLVAGVFLAFSDFVMKSLAAAHPACGIESMQLINRRVYRSVFLVLLMGMTGISLVLLVAAIVGVAGPASVWIGAGGVIYLVGVFGVTMICNVPMNKRLDGMGPAAADTATYWRTYGFKWTRWNHVRAAASAGSVVCFHIGSLLLAAG